MAGLIFLWQNVVSVPAGEFDQSVSPTLSFVDTELTTLQIYIDYPTQLDVLDAIASFLVDPTSAGFGNSTTLVNDTAFLVNDPISLVGGSDNTGSEKPDFDIMLNERPILKL
jgi:hypothetical protein